ncbi:unnamed protein product [Lymnaea stagnalis]|uniref:DEX1 C-terminal domain-containing protein n=1 Tax=Lymnaea stagnalis TaxID=6523 RepID=A0AAV2H8D6_LYMST
MLVYLLKFFEVIVFSLIVCDPCLAEEGILSKQQSAHIQRRCPYTLRRLWQTDISSFPFAAVPLLTDIDGDGGLDIVAAPFGETLAVIEGETGKHLHDSGWPQHNLDKSVHSSPLLYDIDDDGISEILFVTSQGEGLFYSAVGQALPMYTFQLQSAYVNFNWNKEGKNVNYTNIHKHVLNKETPDHTALDPHVLSSPVLFEMRYLAIPISYFLSEDDYDHQDIGESLGNTSSESNIYISAMAVLDLKKLQTVTEAPGKKHEKGSESYTQIFFLEISEAPVFSLFTPTVLDLDGNFGPPEIVIGLTSGSLFVLSTEGEHRTGFPKTLKNISGTVAAANLDDKDIDLELVVLDTRGRVSCLSSRTGHVLWTTEVGGTSFAGSQIVDMDLDGQLDVVVATDQGKVFALNGANGTVLPKYPYKAGRRISGRVLVTKFNALRGPYDLVFLSDDGILHILAGDHSCVSQTAIADTSFVDIITHNLVMMNHGIEFIVSTSDGSLICLGSGSESPVEEIVEEEYRLEFQKLANPSDIDSQNNFLFSINKPIVLIDEKTRYLKEVTGSSLDLYFSVHGAARGEQFKLQIFMGSTVVHKEQISDGSFPSLIKVRTPEKPGQAQVRVVIYDQYGFAYGDSIYFKFNQLILLDLQWLVLAPFIAMVIILLVNHGFPAKDLLPVTFPLKSK